MSVGDILSKILEILGIKKTEKNKLSLAQQKFKEKRARNHDQIDQLKEEIATLERRAKSKKKEYDQAHGDTQRVVGAEIERVFESLGRLQNREAILNANITKLDITIAKIEELKAAQEQGLDQDVIDDLAVDLEDVFADLKETDRAAAGLEKVRYPAAEKAKVDIDARMTSIMEAGTAAEGGQQVGISDTTMERLKALESEDN